MSIEQETVFLCMNSGCIGHMFARGLTPKWLHFVLLIVTKIEDILEDLFDSTVQLDTEVEKQRCISNGIIFDQYHHNILDVHKWGVYTLVIPKPLFSPIKSMPVCQYTWYWQWGIKSSILAGVVSSTWVLLEDGLYFCETVCMMQCWKQQQEHE